MDILVAEDVSLVSLEEALSFIDDCDITDHSLTQALIGNSPVDFFNPTELKSVELKAPVTPTTRKRAKPQRKLSESSSSQEEKSTKKRRVRSAASSSTRLQQRKREELKMLREQAQELETQVELLKKNKFLSEDVVLEPVDDAFENQNTPASWHDIAMEEYKERLVSEKTNRRLKSILENQEKVNGALHTLLQKRSVLNGMDYVFSSQLGMGNLLSGGSGDEPVAAMSGQLVNQLEELVQCIYKRYKVNFTATTQTPAISCDMRVKHDAKRGKTIDFVVTTPLTCAVDKAGEILWEEFTSYRGYPGKTHQYVKATKPNTNEKKFVLSVKSPSGMIELDGLQFMQRFEDSDRTAIVIAEHMLLPTKGLHFQVECWMTVTPSGNGHSASLAEISLQLYMERDDVVQVSSEDVAYAQNIVLGSLSNNFRKNFQALQNTLMEKAGRATLPSAPITV